MKRMVVWVCGLNSTVARDEFDRGGAVVFLADAFEHERKNLNT